MAPSKYDVIVNCEREFRDADGNVERTCKKTVPSGKDNRYWITKLKRNIALCPECAGGDPGSPFYRKDINKTLREAERLIIAYGHIFPLWPLLGRYSLLVEGKGEEAVLKGASFLTTVDGKEQILDVASLDEKGRPLDSHGKYVRPGSIHATTEHTRQGQWRRGSLHATGVLGRAYLKLLQMFREEIFYLLEELSSVLDRSDLRKRDREELEQKIKAYQSTDAEGNLSYVGDFDQFLKYLGAMEAAEADIQAARDANKEIPGDALRAIAGRNGPEGYKRAKAIFGSLATFARRFNVEVPGRTAALAEQLKGENFELKTLVEDEEPTTAVSQNGTGAEVGEETMETGNKVRAKK